MSNNQSQFVSFSVMLRGVEITNRCVRNSWMYFKDNLNNILSIIIKIKIKNIMVYKSLRDYSFSILITLNFIKPYGNIMNLYAFFCIKRQFYLTIFSSYHELFAILWLNCVDNYL